MDNSKYIEDLRSIKDIMSRSAQLISLSGLSGVSTGITALAGLFIAYQTVFKDHDYLNYHPIALTPAHLNLLLLIAIGTLFLSIAGAIFFTNRKTIMQQQSLWDIQTKRLLINLAIPLVTGGLLCLMLLHQGFVGMLPSMTLIFYGLSLVNGSKYTLPEIRNLGLLEILLGLLAFQFIGYGLVFWALGFGIVQIIYGLIIQRKY
jgi:hypothetical protein